MESVVLKKSRKMQSHAAQDTNTLRAGITANLSACAGISALKQRDPVYELSECFRTRFDAAATEKAQAAAAKAGSGEREENPKQKKNRRSGAFRSRDFPGFEHSSEPIKEDKLYRRFSETAFNNGKFSGAVTLGGTETMFVSCLERAAGLPFRPSDKQKTLNASSAAEFSVRNYSARLMFNRFAHGAAGIILDSLMDADRILSMLEKLADGGEEEIEGNDVDTYRNLFPFLSCGREIELLSEYEAALARLKDGPPGDPELIQKKMVLTQGRDKLRAIINRKNMMKHSFMLKLHELMRASQQAREQFSDRGFVDSAAQTAFGAMPPGSPDGDQGRGEDNNEQYKEKSTGIETDTKSVD